MNNRDLQRELANLKQLYANELGQLEERSASARKALYADAKVSSHDAFNMSATCQNLAVLAGKIEQTANVIRWMSETAQA